MSDSNTTTPVDNGNQDQSQGHDRSGGPAVPLMHRTMDELLSADFPPGLGSVRHADGALSNGTHGNYMDGLDDLFSDDFTSVNATLPQHTTLQYSQSMPASIASPTPSTQAQPQQQPSQPQQSSQQPPQQLTQEQHRVFQPSLTPETPSTLPTQPSLPGPLTPSRSATPSHLSQSPQPSPAMTNVALPMQQNRPPQPLHQFVPPQPAVGRPGFQPVQAAAPPSQLSPRPPQQQQQPLLPQQQAPTTQMQAQARPNPVPNGRPVAGGIARPPTGSNLLVPPTATPSIPIAQAGSPLHNILKSISPATGQQLRNLFALLQSNAVTPSEFLAQAEQLLEPAEFEILDGIRRRHAPGPTTGSQSPQAATATPSPSAGITTAATTNQPMPSSVHAPQTSSLPVSTPGVLAGQVPIAQQGQTFAPTNPSNIHMPNTSMQGVVSTPGGTTSAMPALPSAYPGQQSASGFMTTAGTPQSAPVRKRTTETASTMLNAAESKLMSKRVKTEHQGAGTGVAGTAANGISAPGSTMTTFAAPGSITPGAIGAPSPSAFNRVSLPGQQKTPPVSSVGPAGTNAQKAGSSGVEKVNYDNITDVMGYVGVDLKEESDNIMRDNDGYSKTSGGSDGLDRTRIQNFVNIALLKATVERIGASHKLQTIEPDVLAYLAMATQERLRGLTEQMIQASKHRGRSLATAAPPLYEEGHAMYKVGVNLDVKKQLLAIERVEREEETKRKEQIAERERRLATGEDLDENGEPRAGASGKKAKKQKEGGPGVSARNMTEEARKKVANQTALSLAGGSGRSYSWMMGGGGGAGGSGGGAASPAPSAPASSALTSSAAAAAPASAPSPSASAAGSIGPLKTGLARGATMPAVSSNSLPGTPGGVGSPNTGALASGVAGTLPAMSRGTGSSGSMILPPSTLGRPASLRDSSRKVNIKDALFCLERDRGGGGGEGSGQRVLIKSYVKWLK